MGSYFLKFLVGLLLCLGFITLRAQVGIVKGVVKDEKTNSVVEFATISI